MVRLVVLSTFLPEVCVYCVFLVFIMSLFGGLKEMGDLNVWYHDGDLGRTRVGCKREYK